MTNKRTYFNRIFDRFFENSIELFCIVERNNCFMKLASRWEKMPGNFLTDIDDELFLDFQCNSTLSLYDKNVNTKCSVGNNKRLFMLFRPSHVDEKNLKNNAGLTHVKQIICKHSSSVWAEFQINKETTFFITLPKN